MNRYYEDTLTKLETGTAPDAKDWAVLRQLTLSKKLIFGKQKELRNKLLLALYNIQDIERDEEAYFTKRRIEAYYMPVFSQENNVSKVKLRRKPLADTNVGNLLILSTIIYNTISTTITCLHKNTLPSPATVISIALSATVLLWFCIINGGLYVHRPEKNKKVTIAEFISVVIVAVSFIIRIIFDIHKL